MVLAIMFLIKLYFITVSMSQTLKNISSLEQNIKNVRQEIQDFRDSNRQRGE